VDWIHLAQDRDQSQALVNMVMNLRVIQKAGNFLTNQLLKKPSAPFSQSQVQQVVRYVLFPSAADQILR
jgi:hypothetical protein